MEFEGVELILRLEDEFSINISDDEAMAARTAGDLCDLVMEKLRTDSSRASNMALFRTRRAVVDALEMPRRSVWPSTWLEPLLPRSTRVERWKQIGDRVGAEFPCLTHPNRWKDGFILLSMLLATLLVLMLWWSLNVLGWLPGVLRWLFLAPASAAWFVLASRINHHLVQGAPRLAREIPCKTAGELAEAVLALNYEAFYGAAGNAPSRSAIWLRIVEIFCDELRIGPEDVYPDSRIVEDLGVI